MMKKILLMTLAAVLAVFLTACGTGDNAPTDVPTAPEPTAESTPTPVPSEEPSPEPENNVIDFENVVLADDDVVTVELVQFYEEEVNELNEEPTIDKFVTLKVTNKSEYGLVLFDIDAYIGDEAVWVLMYDGNNAPAPGKSKNLRYCIRWNTSPKETSLDSLDDLYNLNGSFRLTMWSDTEGEDYVGEYSIDFSIPDILVGGEPEGVNAEEIEAALQGTWSLPDGSGSFTFNAGAIAALTQGQVFAGTYTIQTAENEITGEFSATDGDVTVQLPYKFEDGTLHVFNNRGVEFVKE